MPPSTEYIFTSTRLGFRNWRADDIKPMAEINANAQVMEFFPAIQDEKQTIDFIQRMKQHYAEHQFCYFAVDTLDTGQFIGFIGLLKQTYETDFNPCVDIGWRLHPSAWGQGLATEGAKRCLDYGLQELALEKIIAVAPVINIPSIKVMQKIGMKKVKEFKHPKLIDYTTLVNCVLYESELG